MDQAVPKAPHRGGDEAAQHGAATRCAKEVENNPRNSSTAIAPDTEDGETSNARPVTNGERRDGVGDAGGKLDGLMVSNE
jgi:hypothetical protein